MDSKDRRIEELEKCVEKLETKQQANNEISTYLFQIGEKGLADKINYAFASMCFVSNRDDQLIDHLMKIIADDAEAQCAEEFSCPQCGTTCVDVRIEHEWDTDKIKVDVLNKDVVVAGPPDHTETIVKCSDCGEYQEDYGVSQVD